MPGSLSGNRILVVEDSYPIARDVKRTLEAAGAAVLGPFADATDAERVLAAEAPDCVLLDLNLHGGDSLQLARLLRQRAIRFAFFTGYDADVVPAEFADIQCLQKPVEAARLVKELTDLARR